MLQKNHINVQKTANYNRLLLRKHNPRFACTRIKRYSYAFRCVLWVPNQNYQVTNRNEENKESQTTQRTT